MEGTDRLNELEDEMLVNNIMSRLDCTTKEIIKTTATISKHWKNLLTQLSHLIFIDEDDDVPGFGSDLHGYISFIDSTLNQCPNSWIGYAICRNVEDVELCLFDAGVGQGFTFEDEIFFNTSCITRMTLSFCRFNPPNGAISWERLEYLCLWHVTLDEDMIPNILSGSPCLESLKLKDCYGYRRIDVTSKSVKKLVFSRYFSKYFSHDNIDCIKINAPYISSLTIKRSLILWELVLLDVSSLVEAKRYVIFEEEVFRGLLKSLGHVKHITFGNHCSETVLFSPTVQLTVSAVVPRKQTEKKRWLTVSTPKSQMPQFIESRGIPLREMLNLEGNELDFTFQAITFILIGTNRTHLVLRGSLGRVLSSIKRLTDDTEKSPELDRFQDHLSAKVD
ncbi:ribonuclease H-like domain-containing protein [Tanacetum coccineum]